MRKTHYGYTAAMEQFYIENNIPYDDTAELRANAREIREKTIAERAEMDASHNLPDWQYPL